MFLLFSLVKKAGVLQGKNIFLTNSWIGFLLYTLNIYKKLLVCSLGIIMTDQHAAQNIAKEIRLLCPCGTITELIFVSISSFLFCSNWCSLCLLSIHGLCSGGTLVVVVSSHLINPETMSMPIHFYAFTDFHTSVKNCLYVRTLLLPGVLWFYGWGIETGISSLILQLNLFCLVTDLPMVDVIFIQVTCP